MEYTRWLELAVEDSDIVEELNAIKNQPDEIHDRFYRSLSFGTGGMRGKLGAGTNRMNIYTVRQATNGLAEYLTANGKVSGGVAISYDSRRKSRLFAEETAKILSAHGITAKLFDRLMPTPVLSFTVRNLGCAAGIMITASHNPSDYNGYKVYGADGCQITGETADAITKFISLSDPFAVNPTNALIETISDNGDYYKAVLEQRLAETAVPLSIVYTPLNGTGLVPVTQILEMARYSDIAVVASQREPDGSFPSCPKPNPELPEALAEGLKLCREKEADILIATDPDCDRVGVAARDGQNYTILSGNEIGVLLFDYICRMRIENNTMPENAVAVKTIVTTEMAEKVAREYGVELLNVLTGFKYIGETISILEQKGEADKFIFGFEESCGYLSGTYARDKDAVNASLLICDMAAWYKTKDMTLSDAIRSLYKKHGFCVSGLLSHEFSGESGASLIQRFMSEMRLNPKENFYGSKEIKDYLSTGSGLPYADVLQFRLEDETLLTFRPSGTEPLIKVYCSVTRDSNWESRDVLERYLHTLETMLIQFYEDARNETV